MNQAPDSVPAMVKPGEFVLPADTVDAVGGPDALDGVVQATHTPAPEAAIVPQGFEPELFFANGGRVTDEESRLAKVPASMGRRENTTFAPAPQQPPPQPRPQPRPARDPSLANIGMGLPQDNAPAFTSMAAQGQSTPPTPVAAPLGAAPKQPTPSEMGVAVPPSSNNIFPGNRLHGTSGFSGAPIRNADLAPPAQSTPPAARNPAVTNAAMGLPQDGGPQMFASPQMRASLSVPKPAQPQPDNMAGLAATGFHPNMMNKAQRAIGERPQNSTPAAPAAPAQRQATPMTQSPTALFVDEAATEAGKRWDQGDIAGFAGAGARAALGGVGMAAVEALDKTVGAAGRGIAEGAGRFIDGFAGNQAQAPSTNAVPAASNPASAPVAPATPAERQVANTAPVAATAAAPAAGGATGTQVAEGIYSHGRGQYSDDPSGMGFVPGGMRGQPSAQNMRAADNLASNQQFQSVERIARSGNLPSMTGQGFVPGQQAPQMRGLTATHSGNDWNARQRLRSLQTAASSISGTNKERRQAQAAYQQALLADMGAMSGQGNLDAKAMEVNAGLTREGMSQAGATQRAQLHETGADRRDGRRAGLDERRLGMEETAQGFQTRQARRIEELQSQLGTATTEQERANIASQIRAMQGKGDGKDRYITMGGGQVWDANAGAMVNQPQSLFDTQSGQYVTGGQGALPALAQNPKAMAIKNDRSMNTEQKRKALQELGY